MIQRVLAWFRQEAPVAASHKVEPALDVVHRADWLMYRLRGHRNGQAF